MFLNGVLIMKDYCNYCVTGTKGEAVLLVHGSMSTQTQWNSLVKFLSSDYRVISYNILGYGGTPFPADPASYSLKEESELIEAIIKEVLDPYEAYHIIGHSYGGVIALYHSFYNSKRIKSFTGYEPMSFHILEKPSNVLDGAGQLIANVKSDIENNKPLEGVEKFINFWSPPGSFENIPESEKNIMAEGLKKMVLDYRAASETPLYQSDYSTIDIPACLIGGTKSPEYSTEIIKLLSNTLKNNNLHWISAGHFGPLSHSSLVNPIVGEFLHKNAKLSSCLV